MPQPVSRTRAAVDRLTQPTPPQFALLRRTTRAGAPSNVVDLLIGSSVTVASLADIPLAQTPPLKGAPSLDALALIPYQQITERGFAGRKDGTPLQVLCVQEHHRLPLTTLVAALPEDCPQTAPFVAQPDDETYGTVVKRFLAGEIGTGQGSNFVIRRDFTVTLTPYTRSTPLALLRRLLLAERGAYWTSSASEGPPSSV